MSSINWPPVPGGGGGVTSLNTLTGSLSIAGGTGITVTPSGSTLTIALSGAGAGSVTSVAMTTPGVLYSVSGSPITTAGTLALSLIAQSANTILAGPVSGGSANPSFRAMNLLDLPPIATNTILGNNTGGTTTPSSLTATQVTAMLNPFTSSLQGLAPASGGGTTTFLRADGSWVVPPSTSGVSSINGITGAVTLAAGTNVTLTPSGNTITIAATPNAIPQNLYYSGAVTTTGTNYWSSTGAGNFTINGTPPTITPLPGGSGGGFEALRAITNATGNLPGINFVAPRTGVILITITCSVTANAILELQETNSTNILGYFASYATGNGTATITALMSLASNNTYNFVVKSGGGTFNLGAGSPVSAINVAMYYIN